MAFGQIPADGGLIQVMRKQVDALKLVNDMHQTTIKQLEARIAELEANDQRQMAELMRLRKLELRVTS